MTMDDILNFEKLAWWEQLIFEKPKNDVIRCPNSKTLNDSIDVVCKECNASLFGHQFSDKTKSLAINILRGSSVAVALAVGYLNWLWPPYVFGSFILIAFFGLFLRSHKISRTYFINIYVISTIGFGIWKIIDPQEPSFVQIFGLLIAILLLLEIVFLFLFSSRANDKGPRRKWLSTHNIDLGIGTLTWITLGLTVTVLFLLAIITNLLIPKFVQWIVPIEEFNLLMIRGLIVAISSAEIAALISSTIYSLIGEDFDIPVKWKIERPILNKKTFTRIPENPKRESFTWASRVSFTLERITISSANRIIEGIYNGYNNFIVRYINNLVETAVNIADTIRRIIIKTILHIIRSLKRFRVLNKWCLKWGGYVGAGYFQVFILPILFFIISTLLLFDLSSDFFNYVHDGSFFIPLLMILKSGLLVIVLIFGIGLLIHANLFSFFEKSLNALSIFGTSAYLFFLLSAWVLGSIGMLTDGPYTIGWVTILSTVLLILVFYFAQRRQPTSQSSEETITNRSD